MVDSKVAVACLSFATMYNLAKRKPGKRLRAGEEEEAPINAPATTS